MNATSAFHQPPQQKLNSTTSIKDQKPHAIDRSSELLSVAKTALLIAQQEQRQQGPSPSGSTSSSNSVINNSNGVTSSSQSWDILSIQPADLALYKDATVTSYNANNNNDNTAQELLSEAMLTLNHLDETLKKLSSLVKRRAHTNDPTNEINSSMCDFQSFVKDIMEIIEKTLPQAAALPPSSSPNNVHVRTHSSGQRRKHYEMAAKTLKSRVETRMEKFKSVMKVRGDVIKDLTKRRERLLKNDTPNGNSQLLNNGIHGNSLNNQGGMNNRTSANFPNRKIRKPPVSGGVGVNKAMAPSKVKSQLNSPLFALSSPKTASMNPYGKKSTGTNNDNPYNPYLKKLNSPSNSNNPYQTNASSGGAGYGSSGYGGYNHSNSLSNSTGMRHRGAAGNGSSSSNNSNSNNNNNSNNSTYNPYQNEDETKVHDQNSENIQTRIQKRRAARQSKTRLESAKMAEKTLTELTSMFGKMSTLIQSQGETLVKIEDDVEIAMGYVDDGHEEVGKLYEYTKGNRGVIIKSFAILIFFIIFMRFYG